MHRYIYANLTEFRILVKFYHKMRHFVPKSDYRCADKHI